MCEGTALHIGAKRHDHSEKHSIAFSAILRKDVDHPLAKT